MRHPASKGTVCITANTTWYIYNFRRRLLECLIELGYEIVAFSPSDNYVRLLEAVGVQHVHLELNNMSTNPWRECATVVRMVTNLRAVRPTVLLTYTPKVNIYGSFAARLLGIPVIANLSGLGRAFVAGGWLEFVAKRLFSLAFRHPRTVFFENEPDRMMFIEAGLVDPEKTKRLPGAGVDLNAFQPVVRTGSKATFVFLLVGRLLWDKGVGQFVEAARIVVKRFPHAEFRLLGFLDVQNPSAISRAQIEEWEREGIVRYLGATDDVRGPYAEADCIVLPSYYREGVPRTLLEAASMGIPLITTDAIGCRDTVDDGLTGFLVKPRDSADLADKMVKMLSLAPEHRRKMGERGRSKMCRQFDERIVIDHYLKAIQELEQRPHGARE